jgi:hypothetical protein
MIKAAQLKEDFFALGVVFGFGAGETGVGVDG